VGMGVGEEGNSKAAGMTRERTLRPVRQRSQTLRRRIKDEKVIPRKAMPRFRAVNL
jgi:hypothetical protein